MKTYKIFENADGRQEAVKQGWSWPAFLFGMFWSLFKKLWKVSFVVLVSVVSAAMLVYFLMEASGIVVTSTRGLQIFNQLSNIMSVIVYIVFGIFGNTWRENKLSSVGYAHKATVRAKNPKEAIAAWTTGTQEQDSSDDRAPHLAPAAA